MKTEDEQKQFAWEMFCQIYPHEAYAKDPDKFWLYFHEVCPGVSREEMVQILTNTDK